MGKGCNVFYFMDRMATMGLCLCSTQESIDFLFMFHRKSGSFSVSFSVLGLRLPYVFFHSLLVTQSSTGPVVIFTFRKTTTTASCRSPQACCYGSYYCTVNHGMFCIHSVSQSVIPKWSKMLEMVMVCNWRDLLYPNPVL